MKIGLKVYVTNHAYIQQAKKLFDEKVFDYIEVYLVAGKSQEHIYPWIENGIPLAFHAPHSYGGFNPSIHDKFKVNFKIIDEVAGICSLYKPEYVVFHPGISGKIGETIKQFEMFFKSFSILNSIAIIENKPTFGMQGERCVGSTPESMREISMALNVRTCLDFGHAICAARSENVNWKRNVEMFMELKPTVFHLSDGDTESEQDLHLNIGCGNYDVLWCLSQISDDRPVTVETNKNNNYILDDFIKDVNQISELRKKIHYE
jgi:deoxyribonuclease IV